MTKTNISRFASDYYDLKEFDHGTFGRIYKCKKNLCKEVIVVKEHDCNSEFTGSTVEASWKERFLRETKYPENEGKLLSSMSHTNIVKIFDSWREESNIKPYLPIYYFEMEYCDCGSLKTWLNWTEKKKRDGPRIIFQVLQGLNYLHSLPEKIIHRDLKPGNILLKREGGSVVAKIADFGLATKALRLSRLTSRIGTKEYSSPELRTPDQSKYTEKADIYSLGIILAEVLVHISGENMFLFNANVKNEGEQPSTKLFPRIGELEMTLIQEMTSFSPKKRPSADELLHMFPTMLGESSTRPLFYDDSHINCEQVFQPFPPEEKIGSLKTLHLSNVEVSFSDLKVILGKCRNTLLDLLLDIGLITEPSNRFFEGLIFPNLKCFKMRLTNASYNQNLIFLPNSPQNVVEKRMTAFLKLGNIVIYDIDFDKGKFHCNGRETNFMLPILNLSGFVDICLHNLKLENFNFDHQFHSCRKLEIYCCNFPPQHFLGFTVLTTLLIDCGNGEFNFTKLPESLRTLVLKNACTITLPKKKVILENLSFSKCQIPKQFYDKEFYPEHFLVGSSLSIFECWGESAPNFSFILGVTYTDKWEKLEFDRFNFSLKDEDSEVLDFVEGNFDGVLKQGFGEFAVVGENGDIKSYSLKVEKRRRWTVFE